MKTFKTIHWVLGGLAVVGTGVGLARLRGSASPADPRRVTAGAKTQRQIQIIS